MAYEVFISYSHRDQALRTELDKHLSNLKRQNVITSWYDGDIIPGAEWEPEIMKRLKRAQIILLLVSADFMASDFCHSIEMKEAIARHDANQARVIPILLRPSAWKGAPFAKLQALPSEGKAVTSWANHDEAFVDIAEGIQRVVEELSGTTSVGVAQLSIRNVPYARNPLFTGREDVLKRLHTALKAGKTTALTQPQAISGLGGIGKTQTAVEYAYRYQDDYQAILWIKAESSDSLISDFVSIATLLDLPQKQEQEQHRIVEAVKRWFQDNTGWLLIFDNADDLAMVQGFLPSGSKGHILLTTRAHATGRIAQRIEVAKMEQKEGALFLLHRTTLLDAKAAIKHATRADQQTAREIVQAMDGLPLALDQAGAYIEETSCGLQGYLQLYQAQGTHLLKERGELVTDHPDPVATTWSLSFKNVEQANAAAAELLRFCAFLAPDAIPEELFAESAADLGPTLEPVAEDPSRFNAAIKELLKYSLVHRDPETKTLSIHRLVQEVLKDQMDAETQRLWVERAVRAVSGVFPFPEYPNWDRCRRYLLHAQACSALIEQWKLLFTEAASLLNCVGYYLWQRGEYKQIESLHQRALAIREEALGAEHADTGNSLAHLAFFYRSQGKYEQAEPLLQRALANRERVLGPDHPNTATSLNNLASLYQAQGKYEQAEPLYQRALAIDEKVYGPDHPEVATDLNNLAGLYDSQGKYEQAEQLHQHALTIRERMLGPEHPDTAGSLNNLAGLYDSQGKYEQAEPLYQRALAICERMLGPDHPNTAQSLNNLALLYKNQGKYEQAEPLYQRALAIRERVLGPDHPNTATSLNNLASLYRDQGKYEQAELLLQRARAIRERKKRS
jgi:tetratricopeptide (TPR) repeat protein